MRHALAALCLLSSVLWTGLFFAPQSNRDVAPGEAPPSIVYYVAPSGSDSNAGTEGAPFLTLAKARDTIRTATSRTTDGTSTPGGSWSNGAWVVLADGRYELSAELVFDERDGGSASFPIEYRAAAGATPIVSAAKTVSSWTLDTGNIYYADTAAASINRGDADAWQDNLKPALIVGSNLLEMARYPAPATPGGSGKSDHEKASWLRVTAVSGTAQSAAASFTTADTAPGGWTFTGANIYAYGSLVNNYDITWERVTSASGGVANITSRVQSQNFIASADPEASGTQRYIAFKNGRSFLHAGSYVWDYSAQRIYYHTGGGAPSDTSITHLDDMIRLGDSADAAQAPDYITFRGLTLEGARNRLVRGYDAIGIRFLDCTARNFGNLAYDFVRSSSIEINAGAIRNGQNRAVRLHGGNRLTLAQAGNSITGVVVENIGFEMHAHVATAIEANARQLYPYEIPYGPSDAGCGLSVTNCSFFDIRMGVLGAHASHVTFTGNTITRALTILGDMGGVTNAGDYTAVEGVVSGNTFADIQRMGWLHITQVLYPVYADFIVEWDIDDNLFVDCDAAMLVAGKTVNVRRNTFTSANLNPHFPYALQIADRSGASNYVNSDDTLNSINFGTAPWSTTYAYLQDFKDGQPGEAAQLANEGLVILDNMQTNSGTYMANRSNGDSVRSLGGHTVGIDGTQLQYAIPSSGTPVIGGGATALSTMIYEEP